MTQMFGNITSKTKLNCWKLLRGPGVVNSNLEHLRNFSAYEMQVTVKRQRDVKNALEVYPIRRGLTSSIIRKPHLLFRHI